MILAFDFEWTNKQIMYGSYDRTHSLFQNSNMMAVGPPGADELTLLEPYRGKVPDEVFGEPFVPPVTDGSGQDRSLLTKASALLKQGGFPIKNGRRLLPNGEPVIVEFLIGEPGFQPHHLAFIKNLATLGINATLRIVDPIQYQKRRDDFDFDIVVERMSFSLTPGDLLRAFFTSKRQTSKVTLGSPIRLDALVDRVIAAESRPAMISACRRSTASFAPDGIGFRTRIRGRTGSPMGHLLATFDQAALCTGNARNLVVRRGKGGQDAKSRLNCRNAADVGFIVPRKLPIFFADTPVLMLQVMADT